MDRKVRWGRGREVTESEGGQMENNKACSECCGGI